MKGITIKKTINERCLNVSTWVIGCLLSIGVLAYGIYYIVVNQSEWYSIVAFAIAILALCAHSYMGYKDMKSIVQYLEIQVDDTVSLKEFTDNYEIIADYGEGLYKVRPYYIEEGV